MPPKEDKNVKFKVGEFPDTPTLNPHADLKSP